MAVSRYPSTVTLPYHPEPWPTMLEFLAQRFPKIPKHTWEKRFQENKILDESGCPLPQNTPYSPGRRILYFREIDQEPVIPFTEKIICTTSEFIIVDKPHFLPVIPSGPYVRECLLHRLKDKTQNPYLTPINRIDKDTAGLVMFSCNPKTRGQYHKLFMTGAVQKTYEAVCHFSILPAENTWTIEKNIIPGTPWFRMSVTNGAANTKTHVHLLKTKKQLALLELTPVTGKKHQLRIHLASSGYPILNDRLYPDLLPKSPPDFQNPLQLLAKKLTFTDPVSKKDYTVSSRTQLKQF